MIHLASFHFVTCKIKGLTKLKGCKRKCQQMQMSAGLMGNLNGYKSEAWSWEKVDILQLRGAAAAQQCQLSPGRRMAQHFHIFFERS